MNLSKQIFFIAVGIILLLLIFIVISSFHRKSNNAGGGATQFPAASTSEYAGNTTNTTGTISIQSYSKQPIVIKNFKKESGVIVDPNVPGQYDLIGGAYPDPGIPYAIFYQTKDDYFGITLLSEPLGKNRAAAEQQLMQLLGISQTDMCSLDYVVAPGPGVNNTYAGQNLGFSFCPGAVQLPN